MKAPTTYGLVTLSRGYVVVALVLAGAFSPPVYAAIPLLTLPLYLFLEFRIAQPLPKLPLNLFLALSLPLLFQPVAGTWVSPAFALPAILLLDYRLRESALAYRFDPAAEGSGPTRLCLLLVLSLLIVGVMAAALSSWALLLSCLLVGGYLAVIMAIILRGLSRAPVEAEVTSHRVLAGDLNQTPVRLLNRSRLAGQLFLQSPYPWFHIKPDRLTVERPVLEVNTSFAPPLAGPSTVEARVSFLDPWSLVRRDFTLEMLRLFVIPRARYAEWVARRYLEMSRAGGGEPMAQVTLSRSAPVSRRGLEYYGLRSYQTGDSLKVIDWKHTLKLQQMVVKEFVASGVESAIVAVNLSVTGEEEKDKLAYSLISTALTLARENIRSVLTAYNHQKVVSTTPLLDPRQALLQSLSLAQEVTISLSPLRYLQLPDMIRLRGNISRLRQSRLGAATKLAELLRMEYLATSSAAQGNPATVALAAALRVVNSKTIVLVLSGHNHDAEAIAINRYALKEKGYQLLEIELDRKKQAAHLPKG